MRKTIYVKCVWAPFVGRITAPTGAVWQVTAVLLLKGCSHYAAIGETYYLYRASLDVLQEL